MITLTKADLSVGQASSVLYFRKKKLHGQYFTWLWVNLLSFSREPPPKKNPTNDVVEVKVAGLAGAVNEL